MVERAVISGAAALCLAACAATSAQGGPRDPAQRDKLLNLAVAELQCQALHIQLVSVTLDSKLQKAEGCGRVQLYEWVEGRWVRREPEDTRKDIQDWAAERREEERCRAVRDRGADPTGALPVPPECE